MAHRAYPTPPSPPPSISITTAIAQEYAATAKETDAYGRNVQSVLGHSTSGVMNGPFGVGSYMETYQGGVIYASNATGAHVVYEAILGEYGHTGLGDRRFWE